MGRLDDIVARNKRAVGRDNPLVGVVDKLSGPDRATEPASPFTLPSQRKSGTAAWKVIVLMLLLGTAIGFYECRMMDREREHDKQRIENLK